MGVESFLTKCASLLYLQTIEANEILHQHRSIHQLVPRDAERARAAPRPSLPIRLALALLPQRSSCPHPNFEQTWNYYHERIQI